VIEREAALERSMIVVTMLTIFAFSLQQTVVNPTLPALQRDFDTTTAWSTWVLTGFLFVGAVTTPLVGRFADQFGRKPVLQVTLGIFAVASLVAAFAPNIGVLIACRAVSGVSGAFLALCLALTIQHFRPERVAAAISASAASLALGNIVGVTAGPIVADQYSWRWSFAGVAVFAGLALLFSVRGIPAAHVRVRSSIDVRGAALLALAIGALMLALTEANTWGWLSLEVIGLGVASASAAVAWVLVELHVPEPMIDVRILRTRTVAMTVVTTALAGFGVFSWFMLIPRMVAVPRGLAPEVAAGIHYGFGASSTKAGLFMLPAMVVSLLIASQLGPISARLGWRLPLLVALCVLAVAYTALALWHRDVWQVVVLCAVCGVSGAVSSISGKIIADAVPRADHGLMMGLSMVSYYVGGVVGAQVCAAILTAQTVAGTTTPTEGAYATCFYLASAAALVAIPFAALAGSRWRRGAPDAELPAVNQAFG
jgi:MFS family permease